MGAAGSVHVALIFGNLGTYALELVSAFWTVLLTGCLEQNVSRGKSNIVCGMPRDRTIPSVVLSFFSRLLAVSCDVNNEFTKKGCGPVPEVQNLASNPLPVRKNVVCCN